MNTFIQAPTLNFRIFRSYCCTTYTLLNHDEQGWWRGKKHACKTRKRMDWLVQMSLYLNQIRMINTAVITDSTADSLSHHACWEGDYTEDERIVRCMGMGTCFGHYGIVRTCSTLCPPLFLTIRFSFKYGRGLIIE